MDGAAVLASLERAAELCDDLTPRIYARLFVARPDLAAMFSYAGREAAKGEMLSRALEAIVDMVSDNQFGENFVISESVTHESYFVEPDTFVVFFDVIAQEVEALLGPEWTPQIADGWAGLNARLARLARAGALA